MVIVGTNVITRIVVPVIISRSNCGKEYYYHTYYMCLGFIMSFVIYIIFCGSFTALLMVVI